VTLHAEASTARIEFKPAEVGCSKSGIQTLNNIAIAIYVPYGVYAATILLHALTLEPVDEEREFTKSRHHGRRQLQARRFDWLETCFHQVCSTCVPDLNCFTFGLHRGWDHRDAIVEPILKCPVASGQSPCNKKKKKQKALRPIQPSQHQEQSADFSIQQQRPRPILL
jgi:hypothetical protein